MSLITRQAKGSKLTIQEMDGNLTYLEQLAQQGGGGGALPVLTDYPETTPELAGTRFWYKGNEWHYMTQEEIDSTGWTGLVNVGFPAPIDKEYRHDIIASNCNQYIQRFAGSIPLLISDIIDFVGVGILVNKSRVVSPPISRGNIGGVPVIKIRGANLLQNLEDVGTAYALSLDNYVLSEEVINDLFAQLPPTTKTATIVVSNNPGSATCDPTIATAKGYTVIT